MIENGSPQLRRPTSTSYDIAELVDLAVRGRIRVPRFQRSFVWDGDDVKKLFDSIWRGFPIGTLLLWKREARDEKIAFGPFELHASALSDALWVVDGQQRITTLVNCLAPAAASVDPLFELCFDLRRARFVHAGRRPTPPWWLPLRGALESKTLLTWAREQDELLSPQELDLVDEIGGALRDYRIPAYTVEHDDDDDLLREVFDRVNGAGKPISRAQVFHALFGGASDAASATSVIETLRRERFGDLDDQRIVQSLLAIRGGDVQRDLHDEFQPREDPAQWFDETERALSRVITFLRRQRVPHLQLVPSTLPIPVLAAFFYLYPEPDEWNERQLARWLWRGWVHGFGKTGQTPALRQAVRAVNPRKGDRAAAPSESDAVRQLLEAVPDDPPPAVKTTPFRTDSATGRISLLALASLHPKRPDGQLLDLAEEFQAHGVEAVTEFVPNRRTDLAARGFWPVNARRPTGNEPLTILASHAIDEAAAAALRSGDYEGFVSSRRLAIQHIVQNFLAARLEFKHRPRPPLAELVVPDEG